MPTRDELIALRERVQNATGPDRELDLDIYAKVLGAALTNTVIPGEPEWSISPPFYTASIDAALAFVERVLPGAEYEITTLYCIASVSLPLNDNDIPYVTARREDSNVPLAIIDAALTALIEKDSSNG